MFKLILALDFGGTKLTAGLARISSPKDTPEWLAQQVEPSPQTPDRTTDLSIMDRLIQNVLGEHSPDAIGISFGGPIDFSHGIVKLSHHVPGWINFPITQHYASQYHAPTWVDNDANAAALGEWTYGAGRGKTSVFYITISTGVGGGYVINGSIWHGYNSMAGEIGHMMVDPEGPDCLCGKRGCVERLASGPYMANDSRIILESDSGKGKILREIVHHDLPSITAEHIGLAATQGDDVAYMLIKRAGNALGIAIGNTANLLNPECFILGGGVTKIGSLLFQEISMSARRIALPEVSINIYPARLDSTAPLYGAVALALAQLNSSPGLNL